MDVDLIPRKLLFGNPDRAAVQLSPDGEWISWLAPSDGRLNVWVAARQNPGDARVITHDTLRGIRFYTWAYNGEDVLYMQDQGGDENWHIYAANIHSGAVRDLTPLEGVQAQIRAISPEHPGEIVVALNDRVAQWHDLYRIDLRSGERTLILQNDRFGGFVIDGNYNVIVADEPQPDGGSTYYRSADGGWQQWETVPQEDALTTGFAGVDKSGQTLYLLDSRGRNTGALFTKDLQSSRQTLVAEDPRADAGDVLLHPREKTLQAISFTYERKRWQVLDPQIAPDLEYLAGVADGELSINTRTLDDHWWLVVFNLDNSPVRYYLYDRQARRATFLFTNRSALEQYQLAKMIPAVIKARDGLDLVCYYSLPVGADSDGDGKPDRPLPMVLCPHGGPWGRDEWGFDTWHQWLANRGYAVMYVNFRSSTGFGKAFTNAGDFQWGESIIQDQADAVQWAVDQGIADPARVAIMGGSFGGYSALAGLTFFPDLYACGVDIVGPSNLITLLESVPEYWKPMIDLFTSRVGDFRTEEGRALLRKHSPLTYADRIRRPLLIGQGANDPRVKQVESDQIVAALQAKNIPVTYVLYPDEGHGFARPENNRSFYAITEAFLAQFLGGRAEPVGDDFEGSSLQILAGKEEIRL